MSVLRNWILPFGLLIASSQAFAGATTNGIVRDATGRRISQLQIAFVKVSGAAQNLTWDEAKSKGPIFSTTNFDGTFVASLPDAGSYRVFQVGDKGSAPAKLDDLTVANGANQAMNLKLPQSVTVKFKDGVEAALSPEARAAINSQAAALIKPEAAPYLSAAAAEVLHPARAVTLTAEQAKTLDPNVARSAPGSKN